MKILSAILLTLTIAGQAFATSVGDIQFNEFTTNKASDATVDGSRLTNINYNAISNAPETVGTGPLVKQTSATLVTPTLNLPSIDSVQVLPADPSVDNGFTRYFFNGLDTELWQIGYLNPNVNSGEFVLNYVDVANTNNVFTVSRVTPTITMTYDIGEVGTISTKALVVTNIATNSIVLTQPNSKQQTNGTLGTGLTRVVNTINVTNLPEANVSNLVSDLAAKEPTVTKGNLTSSTAGVTIGGGTSAVIGSGTTVTITNLPETQVSNLVTDLAGKQATGNYVTALTGAITGSGPGSTATSLGSFTSANLKTALSDETGSGAAVFGTSPTITGLTEGALSGLTDVTTANATTSQHGLLPKLSGNASDALKGDGTWGAAASPTTYLGVQIGTNGAGQIYIPASAPLTNTVLTTPTIASFVNATHTHQSAAQGGTLDTASIASGTLADARLSTNVPLLNATQTWTGSPTFNNATIGTITTPTNAVTYTVVDVVMATNGAAGETLGGTLTIGSTNNIKPVITWTAQNDGTGNPTNLTATIDGILIAKGTTRADSAATGYIGEVVTNQIASGSAVTLVTTVTTNICNISLTPGDWVIDGVVDFSLTAATTVIGNDFTAGSSTTAQTLGVQDTYSDPLVPAITALTASFNTVIPHRRILIASTTTVYLVAQATFSAGTVTGYGTIIARRAR